MKREDLLKKIKEQARKTNTLRRDSRYRDVLAFLCKMGFLHTNESLPHFGNRRIRLQDAIWAGLKIEPRILEVLPAAFARLPKRFDYTAKDANRIQEVVDCLKAGDEKGPDFLGISFETVRKWYDLPLRDRRVKLPREKKIPRTFRLDNGALERLEELAASHKTSSTEMLERMILEFR